MTEAFERESALNARERIKSLEAENKRLEGEWDDCIEVLREWPLDHELRNKAMDLYKRWIKEQDKGENDE